MKQLIKFLPLFLFIFILQMKAEGQRIKSIEPSNILGKWKMKYHWVENNYSIKKELIRIFPSPDGGVETVTIEFYQNNTYKKEDIGWTVNGKLISIERGKWKIDSINQLLILYNVYIDYEPIKEKQWFDYSHSIQILNKTQLCIDDMWHENEFGKTMYYKIKKYK